MNSCRLGQAISTSALPQGDIGRRWRGAADDVAVQLTPRGIMAAADGADVVLRNAKTERALDCACPKVTLTRVARSLPAGSPRYPRACAVGGVRVAAL